MANKLFLRKSFFKLQMGESSKMLAHISKVEMLARQLQAAMYLISREDVIMTLLSSLPDSYSTLVTALETKDRDLDRDDLKRKLMHEEAKRQVEADDNEKAVYVEKALMTNVGYRSNSQQRYQAQGRSKDKCLYCGKLGHWKRDCRKFKVEN